MDRNKQARENIKQNLKEAQAAKAAQTPMQAELKKKPTLSELQKSLRQAKFMKLVQEKHLTFRKAQLDSGEIIEASELYHPSKVKQPYELELALEDHAMHIIDADENIEFIEKRIKNKDYEKE